MPLPPTRPRSTLLPVLLLWFAFYASFTLATPALLDDADSVHAEVAREMLLRHDYVTLYANGIRYLEKAPLLYWSMAASLKAFLLLGASSPRAMTIAVRLPLAFTMLALALVMEALLRRMFDSVRAGLYAALMVLSSFGMFLFTHLMIPDGMLCLWIALAMLCFWRTEELDPANARAPVAGTLADSEVPVTRRSSGSMAARVEASGDIVKARGELRHLRRFCWGFAACCALNLLTKGLIGVVFPVAIVLMYLWLSRGFAAAVARIRKLHLVSSLLVFLAIAAPWHILAGLANPTQGHPPAIHYMSLHTYASMPKDGNVRGWFWFYFINEHLLRYLDLRVPHDYDTAPLWIFWSLCFVWMMPWSAFAFKAIAKPLGSFVTALRTRLKPAQHLLQRRKPLSAGPRLLLVIWFLLPMLFFSMSTRQEYYVLPALPGLMGLIAMWLSRDHTIRSNSRHRAAIRCTNGLLIIGLLFTAAAIWLLANAQTITTPTDLAQTLQQHPDNYALSMGHFMDLNGQALRYFMVPLVLACLSLVGGPLAALLLRKRHDPHAANLTLAAGAFCFLFAAHLGLQIFAPVLTSAQLADAIRPQLRSQDMLAIHGEYESGSSLAFYLKRTDIHILQGRSSNLWYGSFFSDSPKIFETPVTFARLWSSPQRIFLWQSLNDDPQSLPAVDGPVYVIAKSGGKEIVSNQPNR